MEIIPNKSPHSPSPRALQSPNDASGKSTAIRHAAVAFIQKLGQCLELYDLLLYFFQLIFRPQLTIATSIIYYHRFFEKNSHLDPEMSVIIPSSSIPV
jgi:hypothetical protein